MNKSMTSVMEPGFPRYGMGLCWKSESDFPLWGDNQGGTANVNSSLRLRAASGISFYNVRSFVYETDQNQRRDHEADRG